MNNPTKILPPLYFLAAIVAMLTLDRWSPIRSFVPDSLVIPGVALIVIGVAVAAWVNRTFSRLGTPIRPFERSTELVTGGVFRFSRNPVYLGMIMALLGLGFIAGTLSPFVVIPLFAWRIQQRFVRYEEEGLEEIFGDAYRDYKARVRRWL